MGVSQGTHIPAKQDGVGAAQTRPHAPQFMGLLSTRVSHWFDGFRSQSWNMLVGQAGQSCAASAAGESLTPASPPDEGASAPQLVTRIARRAARSVRMGEGYASPRQKVTTP